MKILFIGGTGVISSGCVQEAVKQGLDITLLTRGQAKRSIQDGVRSLQGDIRDLTLMKQLLDQETFDVVVDWVAFTPDQIEADLHLFEGKVAQFIFISSASAYQKPIQQLPITENTPLSNPYMAYSRNKIACEQRLLEAYQQTGFPITIVRPSHTYDRTAWPMYGGYTIVDRIRKGKTVVVHGDGTSLWTLTHHRDFAKGFIGLLGRPEAIGEAYHITSDELLSWNHIFTLIGKAVDATPNIVHLPSDLIATYDARWGESLLGDKAHSVIFDNSKIKALVPDFQANIPFAEGVQEMVAYYDENPAYQLVDESLNDLLDRMTTNYPVANV
ncbi:MAG: SDR family oxidoreductase [Chloroflexota bacterium]